MATGLHQVKEDNYAFMTCILRVNVRTAGWQKVVSAVLSNIHGISNFRMDEDGRIEVSGTVDPSLLLKMLRKAGKKAEVCWWQFGQCSSNLYIPEYRDNNHCDVYNWDGYYLDYGNYYGCSHHGGGYGGGYGNSVDDRYLHYEGYRERPRVKIRYPPLKEPPVGNGGKGAFPGGSDGLPLAKGGECVQCCSVM